MTRKELLTFHAVLCEKGRALMEKKNHDYAGEKGDDPFANFRRVEALGICSTPQGFLVRMTNKLSRLSTFTTSGNLLVKDEGVEDTLIDLINYSVLLAAYLKEQKTSTMINIPLVIDAEEAKRSLDSLMTDSEENPKPAPTRRQK